MTNLKTDQREGKMTKEVEKQTSKIPSGLFFSAGVASMGVSLTLKLMNRSKSALFVGQWAAPFLIIGLYNKLVKLEGHDKNDRNPN